MELFFARLILDLQFTVLLFDRLEFVLDLFCFPHYFTESDRMGFLKLVDLFVMLIFQFSGFLLVTEANLGHLLLKRSFLLLQLFNAIFQDFLPRV